MYFAILLLDWTRDRSHMLCYATLKREIIEARFIRTCRGSAEFYIDARYQGN